MKVHRISSDNFEDSYLLYYGAGCMGDFLGSLITHSFNKIFDKPVSYHGPDSFYYEPWSKKWLLSDSSDNRFRNFMMAKKNMPTSKGSDELAKLLTSLSDYKKSLKIPFLFVSENLGVYSRPDQPAQILPKINFITAKFSLEYKPLYFWLSLYKNVLHSKKMTHSSETEFITQANRIMSSGYYFPITQKIQEFKKHYEVDMMKLILNNDVQDLDIIYSDSETKNMINLARRDMIEILDFYNLDLYDLKNIDDAKLKAIYHRLQDLINN